MTKKNKGFMLAEVVITSTVVMTAMISLYATFTKIYNTYNIRATYYNIDGVYASKKIADYLITTDSTNNINTLLSVNSNGYSKLDTDSNGTLKALASAYSIKNAYVVRCLSDCIDLLENEIINQTFKDYLEYLKKYYNVTSTDDGFSLIIVEYGSEDNLQYSNIKIG